MKYNKKKIKSKTPKNNNNSNVRKAFTLLELLLVIAIITSLAGLVISALNPTQRLEDASDTKTMANANDLEKALKIYTLDNAGALPLAIQSITSTGIYDICKTGETIGCINLDELVTSGKISTIPEDTRYSNAYKSGYKLKYNPTKSETQIFSEYEYEQATLYCPPGDSCSGPIAEWNLNETSGTTAIDSTGNGNTGTLVNSPTYIAGKSGNALSFDGVNDYMSTNVQIAPATSSTLQSFTAWTYYPGGANHIIFGSDANSTGKFHLAAWIVDSTTVRLYESYYGGIANDVPVNATVPTITVGWHHFAIVKTAAKTFDMYFDGTKVVSGANREATSSSNLSLGRRYNAAYNTGIMDDVRVYNYSRTAEQIAWEYNQGGPIVHWKLNEASGTSVLDSSGNSNNATLTNGPTWTTGKYSGGVNFDGVDDYILGTNTSRLQLSRGTIAAWIKTNNAGSAYRGIVTKQSAYGLFLYDNALTLYDWGTGSARNTGINLANGAWHHVAATFQSGVTNGTIIYIDGVPRMTTTMTISNQTQNVNVGSGGGAIQIFNGTIDEVKIYNYVLTSSQILQSMHES